MAYTPHTWTNGSGEALNETNLNEMETGIEDAHDDLVTHAALDTGVHGSGSDVLATDADITTHAALDTGVHGAGGDTLATDADITTHAALTTGVHGVSGTILGTEDKDVVNGVAALNSAGDILAPGSDLNLTESEEDYISIVMRDVWTVMRIYEGETGYFHPKVWYAGAYQELLNENMKNSANGVSELVDAPASASSTGTAGQIAYDSSYFYVCTATDTWKRVAIASW